MSREFLAHQCANRLAEKYFQEPPHGEGIHMTGATAQAIARAIVMEAYEDGWGEGYAAKEREIYKQQKEREAYKQQKELKQ